MLTAFCVTPEAIAAARAGDVKQLDTLELAWLNAWGPRPDLGGLRADSGELLVPLASEILRGVGRPARTVVQWDVVRPCPRCLRRVLPRGDCRYCWGNFHNDDAWECVYTDIEGRIVEVRW